MFVNLYYNYYSQAKKMVSWKTQFDLSRIVVAIIFRVDIGCWHVTISQLVEETYAETCLRVI